MKRQKSLVDFCRVVGSTTAQKQSKELRVDRSTSSSASISTGNASSSTLPPSDSDLAASDGDDDDPVSCINYLIAMHSSYS